MIKKITAIIAAGALAASTLPAVAAAGDEVPTPVLEYTFDGTNPLADASGANALTLSGGASITDEGNTGKALLLDGVDGYAELPDNILSKNMTISTWVKINKFNSWGRVFDLGEDDTVNFFFAPYSGTTGRMELKNGSTTDTTECPQEAEYAWVNYTVTASGDTLAYYRNGRLIKSIPQTIELSELKNTANYIGKSHYAADAYLSAVIDDFRIYDTALTEAQVKAVVAGGSIDDDVLLESYSIEDGTLVSGDFIDLPSIDGVSWNETDNLGLINFETGAVKHNAKTETVKLLASRGGASREYTVYVTGTEENPYTISVDASDRSKDVSDMMWGLFFEDINSSADGGLYAEMVENGSFENPTAMESWEWSGGTYLPNEKRAYTGEDAMNENNPTYSMLLPDESLINDGYMGMSVKKDAVYDFSMYAQSYKEVEFEATLVSESMGVLASGKASSAGGDEWGKLTCELTASETANDVTLHLYNRGQYGAWIDCVSLMPRDTYKGHGLRKDLMEQLAAMHPKFLRFPGGCAVEGNTMDVAWNWKDTVGDISERKSMPNIWGYQMTYGLGFYEYFQMCEDLDMEPVPILNCGLACQARSGGKTDESYVVPMSELQPYIDDALDLIEFANGTDESNEWVQKRIEMGHKEPFGLKYIGIGNEQYGDIYFERYAEFAKQIREKYPDIKLITTSGTASSGSNNDLAWNWAGENDEYADRMDEHYYESADWFREHVYRYDNYRRDINTKVFLGEYASKGNTWYNALSEAAYMTGLERNADVVRMASYAPLFAKYGNTQWTAANMIWFDNDDYVLTPNYYVQSLFSNNQGDYSLSTELTFNGGDNGDTLRGGIVLGAWNTQVEYKDVTITRDGETAAVSDEDWNVGAGEWSISDGTLTQTADITGAVCYTGGYDKPAGDAVISLKAKKTGGDEGFQIGVSAADGLNYYRVNIGGWENTTAKVQRIADGVSAETGSAAEQAYVGVVHINDNEWYDVRVELTSYEIRAYLNDTLVCSYIKPHEYGPVYSSSVYDEETGEVILKLVNTMDSAVTADVEIGGADIAANARLTVMSGDTKLENSLDDKTAIAPVESEITYAASSFAYTMPANSFSVIRLSTAGNADGTITRAEAAQAVAELDAEFDENGTYPDMFTDTAGMPYVSYMAGKGVIDGYDDGTFKPENTITRAEFAAMLCRYLGLSEGSGTSFTDVSADYWAAGYIAAAAEQGVIYGYDDGTFKPGYPITRTGAELMISRIKN